MRRIDIPKYRYRFRVNLKRITYRTFTRTQLIFGGSILVIFGSTITFFIIFFVSSRNNSIIPQTLQQHIAFQIYAPNTKQSPWTVPKNSVTYNDQTGILTIVANSASNSMSMSEQQSPQIFTNIPQYYPTLLNKLNEYNQVQSNLGTVALTKPTELHGEQTAVLNSNGTLVFVRPKHNISEPDWTNFFNNLIVVH